MYNSVAILFNKSELEVSGKGTEVDFTSAHVYPNPEQKVWKMKGMFWLPLEVHLRKN